jgi:hypothetical protein
MKRYIGTKVVLASPINREAYNRLRGWEVPADEDGADEGYLVQYLDGGKPNHPNYPGYVSWSPKEQFENAYRATDSLSFGMAVDALKRGLKVTRRGWNGRGMWLRLVSASGLPPDHRPYIEMFTVDGKYVPWVASQSDLLVEDWELAE